MNWWSILEVGVGVVAGGFLNWLFSLRSSRELRREAERLRRHTNLILRGLEEMGKAESFEWNRNEQGEIVGISFKRTVRD